MDDRMGGKLPTLRHDYDGELDDAQEFMVSSRFDVLSGRILKNFVWRIGMKLYGFVQQLGM